MRLNSHFFGSEDFQAGRRGLKDSLKHLTDTDGQLLQRKDWRTDRPRVLQPALRGVRTEARFRRSIKQEYLDEHTAGLRSGWSIVPARNTFLRVHQLFVNKLKRF